MAAMLTTTNTTTEQTASGMSLNRLVEKFVSNDALHEDLDVRLADLRMTPASSIQVGGREFVMNDWSRTQLAKVVGISWDRWFFGASAIERAEEMTRRFGRSGGLHVRLRTTKAKPDGVQADGTLRAVVSPSYTAMPDSILGGMLCDALRGVESDAKIVRAHVGTLTTGFLVRLGEAYKIGGPGNVGDIWGCLYVRNSGVGYTRLTVSLFLHRLACRNGMSLPIGNAVLVRARHRGIDHEEIRASLRAGLDGIGEKLLRGTRVLGDAALVLVENVEHEVEHVLRAAHLPKSLGATVMRAYQQEPHASRFGVSQALTLAAQWMTPEMRFEVEQVAGSYLSSRTS